MRHTLLLFLFTCEGSRVQLNPWRLGEHDTVSGRSSGRGRGRYRSRVRCSKLDRRSRTAGRLNKVDWGSSPSRDVLRAKQKVNMNTGISVRSHERVKRTVQYSDTKTIERESRERERN